MASWNMTGNPWILSLDEQTVLLNTQGTYVPNDMRINVISGSAGTITAGSASIQSIQVTTGDSYFTDTPTAYAVGVRADAAVGRTDVDPQSFAAGWVSSAPTITQGSSDSYTLQTYIKAATTTGVTTGNSGTEVISTAGWIDSLKLTGITTNADFSISSNAASGQDINITNTNDAIQNSTNINLTGAEESGTLYSSFDIYARNVDTMHIYQPTGSNINDITYEVQNGGIYSILVNGSVNEVEFKKGQTTIPGNEITITGPSQPITVSGGGWNSTTKQITIDLSAAVISSTGETTLTQISGGVISGGNTYLGFSSSSTTTVTSSGFVEENDSITFTDSEIQTAIMYYAGAIDQPTA